MSKHSKRNRRRMGQAGMGGGFRVVRQVPVRLQRDLPRPRCQRRGPLPAALPGARGPDQRARGLPRLPGSGLDDLPLAQAVSARRSHDPGAAFPPPAPDPACDLDGGPGAGGLGPAAGAPPHRQGAAPGPAGAAGASPERLDDRADAGQPPAPEPAARAPCGAGPPAEIGPSLRHPRPQGQTPADRTRRPDPARHLHLRPCPGSKGASPPRSTSSAAAPSSGSGPPPLRGRPPSSSTSPSLGCRSLRAIQVDGGSEFMAGFEAACGPRASPLCVPAQPQAQGRVERLNGTASARSGGADQGDLDLPALQAALRDRQVDYNAVRTPPRPGHATPSASPSSQSFSDVSN